MEPQGAVRFLEEHLDDIRDSWVEHQKQDSRIPAETLSGEELAQQSARFLDELLEAAKSAGLEEVEGTAYDGVRKLLSELSFRRERLGAGALAMARWTMSLREHWVIPFLSEAGVSEEAQGEARSASRMLDRLAMAAYDERVRRGESLIRQQADEIMEISTPVIKVWEGVVAAPLIGTLDSERTQRFMERLLETIAATNSPVALVDITGVPTVDTQTAQHLIDTVSAVRLLGSRVILTGVRPSIAQTLVHLGISMSNIITRSSFAAGLKVAMEMLEIEVSPVEAA